MAKEKVVLAYSGGLDTSIIVTWLKENYDFDVICVCCNAGQSDDFDKINQKALATGASKSYVLDIQEEFITDYIWPTLKAGAIYENDYLLGTSMARPLMAKKLVEIANQEGAYYIVHGCTGKGDVQVRFEESNTALGTSVENIWHISHEGGNLENPWNEHLDDIHVKSVPIEKAPDKATYVDITFKAGVPVALDGVEMGPVELLTKLNELGSVNGVGTIDIIENRLVGMKSRGVYETPGGTILYKAHAALEKLILDRDSIQYKNIVSQKFAQLVYDGLWFTPLRAAISAFVDSIEADVDGIVKMKLYKGSAIPAATQSPNSLYSEEFATFSKDEVYNQSDAEGFINLFSLPLKIRAIQKQIKEGGNKPNEALERKIYKNSDFIC